MTCLTDARIQAVVDREATAEETSHVATCPRCGERAEAREHTMAALAQAISAVPEMPRSAAARVERSLQRGTGATRLRAEPPTPLVRRAAWSALAIAAATLALVLFAPSVMNDRGAVTAAEILAASADRLAAAATTGVEILEYDLVAEVPADMAPEYAGGICRVRKAIDHAVPGRFRFATYSTDGRLVSAIAQDPLRGTRTIVVNPDGQPYRFDFTLAPGAAMSLPELEQLHMQATVRMMQASGDQMLDVVDGPSGRQYRIEVPEVKASSGSPLWDLTHARVIVDANDYRILEFAVKGTFLEKPYSVSFKLQSREMLAQAPAGAFELDAQPDEIVLHGEGTAAPPRDAFLLALRELARMRQTGR